MQEPEPGPDAARTCLACRMTDPPQSMTCHQRRDHRVGPAAGCPACGRLRAACAWRPCSVMRRAQQQPGTATARLRLAVPRALRWRTGERPGPPPRPGRTGQEHQ